MTGPILQEKAARAVKELSLSELKASNGWLDRFKNHYNIKGMVISREAGDVKEETDPWKEQLPGILSGYTVENILNMDETRKLF